MRPEDREKMTFVSLKSLYQFVTMPFSLIRAPATFQVMMDSILRENESFAGVYLDEIIIYSETWEDQLNSAYTWQECIKVAKILGKNVQIASTSNMIGNA